jgi:hypothetical protein
MLLTISLHKSFSQRKIKPARSLLISSTLFILAILPSKSFAAGYNVDSSSGQIQNIFSDPYFTFQNIIINPTAGSVTPNDPLTGLGGDYHPNTYAGIILNTGSYSLNQDGRKLGWNESLSAVLISAPSGSSVSNISFTNNSSIGNDTYIYDNSFQLIGGPVTDTGIVIDGSASSSTITNNGNIFANTNYVPQFGRGWSGIFNAGISTSISNSSVLNCSGFCSQSTPYILGYFGVQNVGSISSINNAGYIGGYWAGIGNYANEDGLSPSLLIQTITNSGTIHGEITGIENGSGNNLPSSALIDKIINTSSGVISAGDSGIFNFARINTIENAGSIDKINNAVDSTSIGVITNTGTIGLIANTGTISTINNLQNNLNLHGNVPTNYNIIINSPTNYGQLNISSGAGSMIFGVSNLSAKITSTSYLGVLSGTGFTFNTSGTYLGANWSLIDSNSDNLWDLIFSTLPIYGPSASNTNLSLEKQSGNLMSAFNLQKASINLGLNYDCTTFDSNGVCLGVGGRYTSLDSNSQFNNSSAMVVTSIKLGDNFRVGGYLDQNVSSKLTDISLSNNKGPLGGLFIVLAQNDKTHQGYELRLAGNYQSKHADISRQVIGDSQAGSGNASLESYGALAQISYGFKASAKILLTQYLGVRYSQIKRSAYVEGSNVSTPLSYSELKDESTTALAGLKLNIALADDFNIQGHLGIEDDVHQKIGNLTATGIDGLAPIVMSNDKNKFRGVASLGAALNISKYQVLRGSINYQQMPYQTKAATTAMFTYEIGL